MNTKQVIVLRKDLNMRKGKMVAQGCHASMKVFFNRISWCSKGEMHIMPITTEMENWINGSFTKICVSVDSEEQLLTIYEKAKMEDIPCSLIQDIGKTEFNGVPTYTAVAVGPALAEDVDKITGHLKLL